MLHKFSMNGINILMDILSGAVHAVDDVAYDIADKMCIRDSAGTCRLRRRG